jgi:RNA polymerase sigma factor (sigma-70 family)
MAAGQLDFLHKVRWAVLSRDGGGLTDGELLGCYLDRRDGAAFAALVRRHGQMVLGVCRRVLGNTHDAEDAFQAAFLVLVRRAASVVPREGVGNWLYGVAYRTALEARTRVNRRRSREREGSDMRDREDSRRDEWAELRALLDEELHRLPEKYRTAIVLCELEGQTVKEAARQLGLPQGTLASRLSRGRRLLTRRLSGFVPVLGVATLTAALPVVAAPARVPVPLVVSLLEAARPSGRAAAGVAALSERMVRIMLLRELRVVTALLLAIALFAAGALTYGTQGAAPAGEQQPGTARPAGTGGAKVRQSWKGLAKIAWQVPNGVAFVGDGKTLASSGITEVKLWDLDKEREVASFAKGVRNIRKGWRLRWTSCLAVARGGKILATGDQDGTITVWDVATGNEVATFLGHQKTVRCLAFSPDGKTLTSGAEDNTVRLWDVAAKKERAAGEGRVNAVAFSPDGKTLATGDNDNTVKLWDTAEFKVLATLDGHSARVTALAYAHDGKTLVSGGADSTVRLWDLATRKERLRLQGQIGRADAVAFTPDGKSVVSSGYEKGKDGQITGLVRIWDVASGEERAILRANMGLPTALAVSPDGRRLALGGFTPRDDPVLSNEGSLEVWELGH